MNTNNNENSTQPDFDRFTNLSTSRPPGRTLSGVYTIALAVVVNLGLLAMVGYFNTSSKQTDSKQETWHVRTVQVQQHQNQRTPSPRENEQRPKREEKNQQEPEKIKKLKQENQQVQARNLRKRNIKIDLDQNPNELRTENLTGLIQVNKNGSSDRLAGNDNTQKDGPGTNGASKKPVGRNELDALPRKKSGPEPDYPWSTRRRGIEGWVLLKLDISADGELQNVDVLDWEGAGAFKNEAVRAVRNWTFTPGKKNGKNVPVKNIRQKISFKLK